MTTTRPTAVAGRFYPADPAEAGQQIRAMLAQVPPSPGPVPKAIIAPHAGWIYSGPVAATAYAQLIPARGKITRVVLLGPSHRVALAGLALSGAEHWASPLGAVRLDRAGAATLLDALPFVTIADPAHAEEHALEVHLPFLQTVLGPDVLLLPIVVGNATPDEVAEALDLVWGETSTLIVVSTDLSHYLDHDSCRRRDAATAAMIERLDPSGLGRDRACGWVPLAGLMLAGRRRDMSVARLDLRTSGDVSGLRGRVVGYGAWALHEARVAARDIREIGPLLLDLAWRSIRHGLDRGTPLAPPPMCNERLNTPGAVFVTLKQNGVLRGCIGSATAWRPLAEDVADNAFKAAFRDPRFPPLVPSELAGLTLSLSVLTPPTAIAFGDEAELIARLRPRRDGLIIEDGGHRALFLPAVWDLVPDRSEFLARLKVKAGLRATHWSPSFRASRFEAVEIDGPAGG